MADYEDFLYDEFPFPESHPDRLATVATLTGRTPPPVQRCRVLELGCALGANLIPMALGLPDSTFVGVDLSRAQIDRAQALADELGLTNLTLHAMDILQVGPDLGRFDYLVCHGVFSWVPAQVRAKILLICRDLLAPDGVAYVSYNTLPGWHLRQATRRMLLDHVDADAPRRERVAQARAFLAFLRRNLPERSSAAQWLRDEVAMLDGLSDAYLFYEYLVEHNHPLYFRDFVALAERAGLTVIGDADVTATADRFGADAAADVAAFTDDPVRAEQYLDYLGTRFFRRSLLCRADVVDGGPPRPPTTPTGLRVRASIRPVQPHADPHTDGPQGYCTRTGVTFTAHGGPMKAALAVLAERTPTSLPFADLCAAAADRLGAPVDDAVLGPALIRAFQAGHVELCSHEPPVVTAPSRPRAGPLARLQARTGSTVTSALHHSVDLDPLDRVLLAACDGRTDLDALAAHVVARVRDGTLQITRDRAPCDDPAFLADITRARIRGLARAGLLG